MDCILVWWEWHSVYTETTEYSLSIPRKSTQLKYRDASEEGLMANKFGGQATDDYVVTWMTGKWLYYIIFLWAEVSLYGLRAQRSCLFKFITLGRLLWCQYVLRNEIWATKGIRKILQQSRKEEMCKWAIGKKKKNGRRHIVKEPS